IDISNHQKNIDWESISKKESIYFAFIKATEGESYKDKYFKYNWEKSLKVGIYRGAYHYYISSSTGENQAKNFIEVVPKESGSLPPVVDIEEDGLSVEEFDKELGNFNKILEETYGQKPIIYTVSNLYEKYIKGKYKDNPIWIRDIVKPPNNDKIEWQFWQYSNRGHISGIDSYVDLNVFNGDENDFKTLIKIKE
ncbi:MAG: GH25 family lysozyme, partial [Clostridiales bacterium]